MPPLTRSAFGANPNLGAARNVANGWTGVWPGGVPRDRLGTARAAGVAVTVQRDLVPLVETLLRVTEMLGYDVKAGQTWGYANRPIRGTNSPSNHSRGKAIDINSLANPMQASFKTDLPPKVVAAWENSGWYWGGRYLNRPDAMHFEYLGRPSDVARDLAAARAILAKLEKPKAAKKKAAAPKAHVHTIRSGDTVSGLVAEHAPKGTDWRDVWKDPRNRDLRERRDGPGDVQPGDRIWVP